MVSLDKSSLSTPEDGIGADFGLMAEDRKVLQMKIPRRLTMRMPQMTASKVFQKFFIIIIC